MKKYNNNSPEFLEEIDIFETTDPGHADILNMPIRQIYDNTMALKQGKVDKVIGKGLSSNDYTTADKNKISPLAHILNWRAYSGSFGLMYNKITDMYSLDVKPFINESDNSGYSGFNYYFTNGCKIYATISINNQLHKICVDLGSPSGSTSVKGSAFSHIGNNGFLLVEINFSVDVEDGAWMVYISADQTEYRFLKDGTFSIKDKSALSQYTYVDLRELSFAGNENIDSMVRNGSLPGGY